MTESTTPCLSETTQGKVQPTPEQLRQAIELAVLHCIQYKARAIEAAEQYCHDQNQPCAVNCRPMS